jgi:hypothetical protein
MKSKKPLFLVLSTVAICCLAFLLLVLQAEKDEDVVDAKEAVPSESRKDATNSTPEEPSPDASVQKKKRRKPRQLQPETGASRLVNN